MWFEMKGKEIYQGMLGGWMCQKEDLLNLGLKLVDIHRRGVPIFLKGLVHFDGLDLVSPRWGTLQMSYSRCN